MKARFQPDAEAGVRAERLLIDPEAYEANEQRFAAGLEETGARFVLQAEADPGHPPGVEPIGAARSERRPRRKPGAGSASNPVPVDRSPAPSFAARSGAAGPGACFLRPGRSQRRDRSRIGTGGAGPSGCVRGPGLMARTGGGTAEPIPGKAASAGAALSFVAFEIWAARAPRELAGRARRSGAVRAGHPGGDGRRSRACPTSKRSGEGKTGEPCGRSSESRRQHRSDYSLPAFRNRPPHASGRTGRAGAGPAANSGSSRCCAAAARARWHSDRTPGRADGEPAARV